MLNRTHRKLCLADMTPVHSDIVRDSAVRLAVFSTNPQGKLEGRVDPSNAISKPSHLQPPSRIHLSEVHTSLGVWSDSHVLCWIAWLSEKKSEEQKQVFGMHDNANISFMSPLPSALSVCRRPAFSKASSSWFLISDQTSYISILRTKCPVHPNSLIDLQSNSMLLFHPAVH